MNLRETTKLCNTFGAAELTLVKPELECEGDFEALADKPATHKRCKNCENKLILLLLQIKWR